MNTIYTILRVLPSSLPLVYPACPRCQRSLRPRISSRPKLGSSGNNGGRSWSNNGGSSATSSLYCGTCSVSVSPGDSNWRFRLVFELCDHSSAQLYHATGFDETVRSLFGMPASSTMLQQLYFSMRSYQDISDDTLGHDLLQILNDIVSGVDAMISMTVPSQSYNLSTQSLMVVNANWIKSMSFLSPICGQVASYLPSLNVSKNTSNVDGVIDDFDDHKLAESLKKLDIGENNNSRRHGKSTTDISGWIDGFLGGCPWIPFTSEGPLDDPFEEQPASSPPRHKAVANSSRHILVPPTPRSDASEGDDDDNDDDDDTELDTEELERLLLGTPALNDIKSSAPSNGYYIPETPISLHKSSTNVTAAKTPFTPFTFGTTPFPNRRSLAVNMVKPSSKSKPKNNHSSNNNSDDVFV